MSGPPLVSLSLTVDLLGVGCLGSGSSLKLSLPRSMTTLSVSWNSRSRRLWSRMLTELLGFISSRSLPSISTSVARAKWSSSLSTLIKI